MNFDTENKENKAASLKVNANFHEKVDDEKAYGAFLTHLLDDLDNELLNARHAWDSDLPESFLDFHWDMAPPVTPLGFATPDEDTFLKDMFDVSETAFAEAPLATPEAASPTPAAAAAAAEAIQTQVQNAARHREAVREQDSRWTLEQLTMDTKTINAYLKRGPGRDLCEGDIAALKAARRRHANRGYAKTSRDKRRKAVVHDD